MKDEWKFVTTMLGVPSVKMGGHFMNLLWPAGNLDFQALVNLIVAITVRPGKIVFIHT